MKAMDAMVEAMVTAQNPPVSQDDNSANLHEKTFPQKRVDASPAAVSAARQKSAAQWRQTAAITTPVPPNCSH
jgi:hypothetical protein